MIQYLFLITHLQNRAPVKDRRAHKHHPITGHCGWGGVIDVVWLKHNLAIGGHGNAVTIGQCQCAVIIQD